MPKPKPKPTDKAKWIWIARECHREDSYVRARRKFRLAAAPAGARLRVTAFSEYVLYVNGRYVGRGPVPSSASAPLLDTYTEADLPLRRGPNVIAVLAHNPYVGLPRLPRAAGGLWLQLDVTYADGRGETVATDVSWRMAAADDFSRRAPRVCWTAGFSEVRDLRREPAGWTGARFSDRRWQAADDVHAELPETPVPPRPRPRTTPRLAETFVLPRRVAAAGRVKWGQGVTAVPFEFTVPNPAHGEFYAATFVHVRRRRKARVLFDCDEAAAVYVNNRQVLRQGYSETFVHWLGPEEHDEYSGIHRGQGYRAEAAEVVLDGGWNSLGVVLYDPGTAWGFAMRLEDPRTGRPLDLEFSPDQKPAGMTDWHIIEEGLCPCGDGTLPDTPAPNGRTFPDPAYQAAWEARARRARPPARGGALLAGSDGKGPLALRDGEFVVYDFADEVVGHVELDVEAEAGAILDLAWAEARPRRGDIEPVRRGMRQVDRLILRGGRETVRLFNRRALRCLKLIARTGRGGRLAVHRAGVWAARRTPDPPVPIKTDDAGLAAAMALIGRTVRACLQETLEGSPARDAEQSLPAAYLLAQAERTLSGRTDLGEAALRAFAADQHEDGRMRSIVPAGTEQVIPDWNLLWVLWLAEHVAWTGDRTLAKDLYPAAERCLDWTAQFRDGAGLLENKPDRGPPWWLFVDLSPLPAGLQAGVDRRGEVTAWQALYARALRAAAGVAEFLGDEDAAAHGRAEAVAVTRAARQRLWDAERGLFVDARLYEHPSESATAATNYYALFGGLATDGQADRILASLWPDGRAESADWGPRENPYVKYFALEALLERGHVERALAMIRSYWGAMAKAGLLTVAEVFPLPAEGPGIRPGEPVEGPYGRAPPPVLCHGWGVHPAALVAKWILGVRPGGPGFEPLVLAPMPGDLGRLRGRAWTPRGPVEVAIRRAGARREIRVTVPEGMPYRLDRTHLAAADVVEVSGGKAVR